MLESDEVRGGVMEEGVSGGQRGRGRVRGREGWSDGGRDGVMEGGMESWRGECSLSYNKAFVAQLVRALLTLR